MSTTTFNFTSIIDGNPNTGSEVHNNYQEVKSKLEVTGLGVGNLKAKYRRYTIPISRDIANSVASELLWIAELPANYAMVIEGCTAYVGAYAGGAPDVRVRVYDGVAWTTIATVSVATAAKVYPFTPTAPNVSGGWQIAFEWLGPTCTGISGASFNIFCKDLLQES